MGTRSAVIIVADGKEKGYYNQYDGYPEGVGKSVVNELIKIDKKKNGWKLFTENVKEVKLVEEDKKPSKELIEKYKKFFDERVSSQSEEDWYCLLRNLQGEGYIPAIMSGQVKHMLDGTDFVKSSLFCEYAYVIDLDRMVLEFYDGYQKKKQKGNRFGTKPNEDGYYPCAKVGEISLEGISKDERAIEIMMKIYEEADKKQEAE